MNAFLKKRRVWIIFALCIILLIYIYSVYLRLATTPLPPLPPPSPVVERGAIVDRNGRPLAMQTNFYHFVATPKNIKNQDIFADLVSPVLEMSSGEVSAILSANRGRNFAYIKKKITQEQRDELQKILSDSGYTSGYSFDRIPGRVYPMNELASQLIGFMGEMGTGLSGIEASQDALLSPKAAEDNSNVSPNGIIYGKNIFLTIDANLQYKLEKIARDTMQSTQAESIMIIASDAKNGEILSYISLPSVNLNEYTRATPEQTIDRPAVTPFEPGSVFKIFTSAIYLDSGAISPNTVFICDGLYERTTASGQKLRITCLDHHGKLTVREALQYSCNDALAQMSDLLDTEQFLERIGKLGFGKKTGVELSSETRGTVKDTSDPTWSIRTKATMSIGQEISVNALQMVQAATTLSNGGVPVKPTFIYRITDKDGNDEYLHQTEAGTPVLKSSTANYILSCMETTAAKGTGSRANLDDISIGVKTGTAQMYDPETRAYSTKDFLSNCIAIFPVEDPQIVLYIVIQKAKGETLAGRIVAPVIREAADEIIDYMGMTREGAASLEHSGRISISENAPINMDRTVPDFTDRPKRDLLPLLESDEYNLILIGEGWVVRQSPEPGTPITENMTIELYLE